MNQNIFVDKGLKSFFMNIYQYVGANLLLSGAVSFFIASNAWLFNLIVGTPLFYVVAFAPVLLSLYVQSNLEKLSISSVRFFYWLYGACIGASISVIFIIYTAHSIFSCFLMAGAIFIAAAVYGRFTSTDLSSLRSVLMIGVIGILVSMLVNFFLHSSLLQYLLSVAIVIVFSGFIAFDMQRLLSIYYSKQSNEMIEKISIIGALHLFISFINIFLALLDLFGSKKGR